MTIYKKWIKNSTSLHPALSRYYICKEMSTFTLRKILIDIAIKPFVLRALYSCSVHTHGFNLYLLYELKEMFFTRAN